MSRRKPGQKDPYDSLADKAARGDYQLIEPLDYLILGHLQSEGTLFANLYPLGNTAADIAENKFDKQLTVGQVSQRLRSMNTQGLVVLVLSGIGMGGKKVWQRTAKGEQIYKAWKERNGDKSK